MDGALIKTITKIEKATTPKQLAKVAFAYFRDGSRESSVQGDGKFKGTPVDTGRARKSTVLRDNEIQAQYPYAQRLDKGYSKQAPDGMTKPTEKYIEQYVKKQVK